MWHFGKGNQTGFEILSKSFYLFILFLIKGGISKEVLGLKNWTVSPRSGKPIEPGGSFPLHLGFFHL